MLFLSGIGFLQAQITTILDQTLLTEDSFATFTPVSVTGTQTGISARSTEPFAADLLLARAMKTKTGSSPLPWIFPKPRT